MEERLCCANYRSRFSDEPSLKRRRQISNNDALLHKNTSRSRNTCPPNYQFFYSPAWTSAGLVRWWAKYSEEGDLVAFLVHLQDIQFFIFVNACVDRVRLETLGRAALHHVNHLDCSWSAEHHHHVLDGRVDLVNHVLRPEIHKATGQSNLTCIWSNCIPKNPSSLASFKIHTSFTFLVMAYTFFLDALPAAQPTASKHWRHSGDTPAIITIIITNALILPPMLWQWLTQVVLEKRPLNGCSSSTNVLITVTLLRRRGSLHVNSHSWEANGVYKALHAGRQQ